MPVKSRHWKDRNIAADIGLFKYTWNLICLAPGLVLYSARALWRHRTNGRPVPGLKRAARALESWLAVVPPQAQQWQTSNGINLLTVKTFSNFYLSFIFPNFLVPIFSSTLFAQCAVKCYCLLKNKIHFSYAWNRCHSVNISFQIIVQIFGYLAGLNVRSAQCGQSGNELINVRETDLEKYIALLYCTLTKTLNPIWSRIFCPSLPIVHCPAAAKCKAAAGRSYICSLRQIKLFLPCSHK